MPRHAGPYQIVLRRDTGSKPVYYCRFRGEDGSLLPWQSTGNTSKTAARAWAAQKIKRGEGVIRRRFIFSGFAEGWWTENHDYVQGRIARGHRLTATCLVVMRGHLENHVLPTFRDRRLAQITPRQIEQWLLELRRGKLSPSTINHALRCLKIMLKEATRQGVIARDPSAFITGLAESPAERGILSGEEIRKLFDEKKIEKVWAADRKHFTLNPAAASTGLRMGELQALAVSSVQPDYLIVSQSWERRTGLKEGTKTAVGRLVPLPKKTSAQLTALIETSPYREPTDLVFYGADRNTPLSPRMTLDGLYGALERIGITAEEREERRITFHSHRHFLNTLLRTARVPDPLEFRNERVVAGS